MGVSSLFSYLLFSLTAYQALSQTTPPPCCKTKTVTNAPTPAPGQENLNGEYVLKDSSTSTTDKPDPNCADGCVYTKDNEEYCFKNVPIVEAADIVCDATTGGPGAAGSTPGAGAETPGAGASTPGAGAVTPGAGASTPGAGAGTPGAGASTPGAGAGTPEAGASTPGAGTPGAGTPEAGASTPGAGTPGAGASTPGAGAGTPEAGASTPGAGTPGAGATTPGGVGTTLSVSAQGQAAQATLTRSKADKAEAEETKNAADESATTTAGVQSKIDDVISGSAGTTVNSVRMQRQAPTTCAEFDTQVKNMNTEINKKTKEGFKEATRLGKILVAVVASTITCDATALAALKTTKTAVAEAKAVISLEIAVQQNKIKTLIETINVAIATLKEVNVKLVAAGQTAFADPGTLLPTVTAPILPTQAPAAGATTPAGGAGETSPAGGAGATTPAGGAGATTPAGGAGATTPAGGAGATTPVGGAGATTPAGGAGATTPAGGAGATTPAGGAGATTPAGGTGATMVSTANPNARQLLFGKRSRGSIM